MILIVDIALGTVSKGLKRILGELEIRRRIQTTVLLRSTWILQRVLEIWVDFSDKPSIKTGVKNFAKNEKESKARKQTIRIYSQDKGMEFGIEICVYANNEKRKKTNKE